MGIFLVRVDDVSEQLILEGRSKVEDVWSGDFTAGEISRQLADLGVTILPPDHTQEVDGSVVNIHPLQMSGRVQRMLATTYFLDDASQGSP